MSRPRADTMPAVTVPPRPNGFPTARTQSPMRGDLSESFTYGNGAVLYLDQRQIGARISPDHLGVVSLAIIRRDLNAFGLLHDVIVGYGIAVRRNDEA